MRHFALVFALLAATAAHAQQNGDANPPGSAGSGATTPSDPIAQATAEANEKAALYTAQAAASNAQKSAIDAKLEAAKAGLGSVTGLQTTGGESVTPGTPLAEGTLLVSRAALMAADDIAKNLGTSVNGREVLILTDISQLSTSDAMQFDLQFDALTAAAAEADQACDEAISAAPRPTKSTSRFALGLIGPAVDAVAKLATYFQTDYTFASVQVTEPSNLTAAAVAGAIKSKASGTTVVVPANLVAFDASGVMPDLRRLSSAYLRLAGKDAKVKALSQSLKKDNPDASAVLDAADGEATKALSQYDTFIAALTGSPQNNAEPAISRIVRQRAIQRHLSPPNVLVLLVVDQQVAENYTKKNLWTFLGGPPLYTMVGVSDTYVLFDPHTGGVITAGVIPKHGGYKSVDAVQKLFP